MAEVSLSIGGYAYKVACRDGEEPHLLNLGQRVDAKVVEARSAVGNASEVRQLLLAALLFADEASEAGTPSTAPIPDDSGAYAESLERLADKLETLAARLETQ
jgi:cell division protein ZapA